jgi:hypothetical protein
MQPSVRRADSPIKLIVGWRVIGITLGQLERLTPLIVLFVQRVGFHAIKPVLSQLVAQIMCQSYLGALRLEGGGSVSDGVLVPCLRNRLSLIEAFGAHLSIPRLVKNPTDLDIQHLIGSSDGFVALGFYLGIAWSGAIT